MVRSFQKNVSSVCWLLLFQNSVGGRGLGLLRGRCKFYLICKFSFNLPIFSLILFGKCASCLPVQGCFILLSTAEEGQGERIGVSNCFLNRFSTSPPVFSSTLTTISRVSCHRCQVPSLFLGMVLLWCNLGCFLAFSTVGLGIQLSLVC